MSSGPTDPNSRSRATTNRPGTGPADQPRSHRPRPSAGRQRTTRDPFPLVMAAIGIVAVLATIITIVILAQPTGPTTTAAIGATPTSVPTATPAPTATLAPVPTVAVGKAPAPSAAELAASVADCSPFAKAGHDAKGAKQWGAAPSVVIDKTKHYQAKIYTTYGLVTADILPKLAPIAANNFVFLACHGYFDGLTFHRVVPGFVIQGGDPKGNGSGGPGYSFKDEKVARAYQIGDLAMANSGANTNGSQFFVMQGAQATSLPQSYSLFGHVTSGMPVVNTIALAPAHVATGSTEKSTPDKPVKITRITILVS